MDIDKVAPHAPMGRAEATTVATFFFLGKTETVLALTCRLCRYAHATAGGQPITEALRIVKDHLEKTHPERDRKTLRYSDTAEPGQRNLNCDGPAVH